MQVNITLLMVFLSFCGIPGFSSATLLMGIAGDIWELRISFLIAPVYLFPGSAKQLAEHRVRGTIK